MILYVDWSTDPLLMSPDIPKLLLIWRLPEVTLPSDVPLAVKLIWPPLLVGPVRGQNTVNDPCPFPSISCWVVCPYTLLFR